MDQTRDLMKSQQQLKKDSTSQQDAMDQAMNQALQNEWKDHLAEMDYLRSGIGLRAMGQRDPLVEYQNEGYLLFEDLIENVKFSVIRILFNFDKNLIVKKENNINDKVKDKTIIKDKIGRNDPCPLGCGIKYKKCGIDNRCKKISETN